MFKLYFFTPLHTFVFLMSEGSTSTVLLLNVDSLINQSINIIQFRQILSNPNFLKYFIPILKQIKNMNKKDMGTIIHLL